MARNTPGVGAEHCRERGNSLQGEERRCSTLSLGPLGTHCSPTASQLLISNSSKAQEQWEASALATLSPLDPLQYQIPFCQG